MLPALGTALPQSQALYSQKSLGSATPRPRGIRRRGITESVRGGQVPGLGEGMGLLRGTVPGLQDDSPGRRVHTNVRAVHTTALCTEHGLRC